MWDTCGRQAGPLLRLRVTVFRSLRTENAVITMQRQRMVRGEGDVRVFILPTCPNTGTRYHKEVCADKDVQRWEVLAMAAVRQTPLCSLCCVTHNASSTIQGTALNLREAPDVGAHADGGGQTVRRVKSF